MNIDHQDPAAVSAGTLAIDGIAGIAGPDGATSDPVCSIGVDGGQLVARLDAGSALARPSHGLAEVAEVTKIRASYDEEVRHAVRAGSPAMLTAATETLLAEVYDAIARPLLPLVDGLPRVALDLPDGLIRSLPIETAHRASEPALFEKTQLYRADQRGRPGELVVSRPRRFLLTFHDATISDLDVIALEKSLIRWVSSSGDAIDAVDAVGAVDAVEPLIHVAGHDPTIPEGIVDPDRRAHVVLSGCRSLPRSLPPGVASVVGSLWDVDDHSSSSIMAAYHARLALDIGPVEALRQAQLLHRHLPTGAWAAYVHVGAPI